MQATSVAAYLLLFATHGSTAEMGPADTVYTCRTKKTQTDIHVLCD